MAASTKRDDDAVSQALGILSKDVEIPSREELFDLLEKFCKLAINANRLETQLKKRIQDANGVDIDMIHLLELGSCNAAKRSEMDKYWKKVRQQRREDKDCLLAISSLGGYENLSISPYAAECLEQLHILKGKRTYSFRNKAVEDKFGKLIKQNHP